MDIVDTVGDEVGGFSLISPCSQMNYTRLLWSKIYECRRHDPDYVAVIGISFFIPTVVFVFYVTALFKGKKTR